MPKGDGATGASATCETVANALGFLADAGFDFVECPVRLVMQPPGGDFTSLQKTVQSSRIPATAFNILVPAQMPLVGPNRNMEKTTAYLQEAFARIAQLGGRLVVFGSGGARRVPEGYSSEAARTELIEFLRSAAEAAEPHGITIAVEPLNKRETNIIHTIAEGVSLAEQTACGNVAGLADTYHMDAEGEPAETLIPFAARLAHVHVADTGRLAPGTGGYDYSRLRRCLDAGGYSGRISIECKWNDFLTEAPQALAILRRAWSAADADSR